MFNVNESNNNLYLHVIPKCQLLRLMINGQEKKSYVISTAKNGLGEKKNSEKTPRGWHIIRAKIGHGVPENTVFVGRRPTGEIYSKLLSEKFKNRDWILTRILWLSGLEVGFNRLGSYDTMQRYIYLHGAPDSTKFGIPTSHGCIKMRNSEIIELFSTIDVGTKIFIGDQI